MIYRLAIAGMLFATMGMVATLTLRDETVDAVRLNARAAAAMAPPDHAPTPSLQSPSLLVSGTSIINVAGGLPGIQALGLIKLAIGEHVHAVDGELLHVENAQSRVMEALDRMTPTHPFVDLTIDGPQHERRVLVLANYGGDDDR